MPHPRIIIETIDVDKMRYDTLGDWYTDSDGDIHIQVAWQEPIENVREGIMNPSGFLVAIHELVEWFLCKEAGITPDDVDKFDFAYKGDGEPGDEPEAPYRDQHRKAMLIEHMLADWLNMKGYGTVK